MLMTFVPVRVTVSVHSQHMRPTMTNDHKIGTLKWFDPQKGYGFITDTTGSDVLAHAQDFFGARLTDALPCPGDIVRYRESITPRGTRALAWALERAA